MSGAAKSIYMFNIYRIVLGVALMIHPSIFMKLLSVQGGNEFAFRVIGFVLIVIAGMYLQSAREEEEKFFRYSCYSRPMILVFFVILALLNVSPLIILFGIIETLGAFWTWRALGQKA